MTQFTQPDKLVYKRWYETIPLVKNYKTLYSSNLMDVGCFWWTKSQISLVDVLLKVYRRYRSLKELYVHQWLQSDFFSVPYNVTFLLCKHWWSNVAQSYFFFLWAAIIIIFSVYTVLCIFNLCNQNRCEHKFSMIISVVSSLFYTYRWKWGWLDLVLIQPLLLYH